MPRRDGKQVMNKQCTKQRTVAVRRRIATKRAINRPHLETTTSDPPRRCASNGSQVENDFPHSSSHSEGNSATRSSGFALVDHRNSDTWLPNGCAVGVPVPQATPVELVSGGQAAMESAVMGSIQSDNYRFLSYMIGRGWTFEIPHAYTFWATINQLGPDSGVKEEWTIRNATPLHYAVTCCSVSAAAALLIAFPNLVHEECSVEIVPEVGCPRICSWNPMQLASMFSKLYASHDKPKHDIYRITAAIMNRVIQNPAAVPFLHFSTSQERMASAGNDPSSVLAALLLAAEGSNTATSDLVA